jgi:hypothetical protein
MKDSHPKETAIQEYALDRSTCSADLVDHIESCALCREEADSYRLLFSELKQMPAASFDFDISGLVIPLLPTPEPLVRADRFIAGFLVVFIGCCIGIPIALFNRNIINMFSGIPPMFIEIILGSASLILLVKTFDIYKKYRAQMRQLNYH